MNILTEEDDVKILLKFFAILYLFSACNPLRDFAPTTEDIHAQEFTQTTKPCPKPLYCYTTLSDTLCYETPLKDAHHRLSGQPLPTFGNRARRKKSFFYEAPKEDPCCSKRSSCEIPTKKCEARIVKE